MPKSISDSASPQPTSTTFSSRLPRATGEQPRLTTREQSFLDDLLERSERRFDESTFFRRLAAGAITTEALAYIFGQYGHFRVQLHRWFAACILLVKDASDPAQRQAILALADHVFTDLRDDHDRLFAECLHHFGFPSESLYAGSRSPATSAYIESFLDAARAPMATWFEAIAALSGRELSVALRNRRLLKSYFAPRGLPGPTWITLHAELEVDHFLDVLRPLISEHGAAAASFDAVRLAAAGAFARHAEYLDALLAEHEAEERRRSGE